MIALKNEDLTTQFGKIITNNDMTALLTDQSGKLIWSSAYEQNQQKTDIFSLCKNKKFLISTEMGFIG